MVAPHGDVQQSLSARVLRLQRRAVAEQLLEAAQTAALRQAELFAETLLRQTENSAHNGPLSWCRLNGASAALGDRQLRSQSTRVNLVAVSSGVSLCTEWF